jgi:hypothetical protein
MMSIKNPEVQVEFPILDPVILKGTLSRDFFASGFFHESSSPKPLEVTLGSFRIFLKIRLDIRNSTCTTGINDTGDKFAIGTVGVVDTGGKVTTGVNDTLMAKNGNNIRLSQAVSVSIHTRIQPLIWV